MGLLSNVSRRFARRREYRLLEGDDRASGRRRIRVVPNERRKRREGCGAAEKEARR